LNGSEEIKLCINVRYANGAIPIENAVIAVGEEEEKKIKTVKKRKDVG